MEYSSFKRHGNSLLVFCNYYHIRLAMSSDSDEEDFVTFGTALEPLNEGNVNVKSIHLYINEVDTGTFFYFKG